MQRFEFVTGSALKLHKLFFYNFTKKIPWKKIEIALNISIHNDNGLTLFCFFLTFDCWRFFPAEFLFFMTARALWLVALGTASLRSLLITISHFQDLTDREEYWEDIGCMWLYSDLQLCLAKKIRASSSLTGTKPIKSRRLGQRGRHSTKKLMSRKMALHVHFNYR